METTTTTEPEPTYPPLDCGGNGFYQVGGAYTFTLYLYQYIYLFIYLSIYYQVGESCYTFTFYRSITFKEAETFCNVGSSLTAN